MIGNAKPIWSVDTGVNQYIEAKCEFSVDIIENAILQICADTEYAAYLNGHFVGSGQYRSFGKTRVYDEYDINSFVEKGLNELVITAYSEGTDTFVYQKRTPMLIFAVSCGEKCFYSDESVRVRRHPSYKSGAIEQVSPQLGYTYHYDASGAETIWKQAVVVSESYIYMRRPVKKLIYQSLVEGKCYTQGILERKENGNPAEMMQTDYLSFRDREKLFENNSLRYHQDGAYFILDLGTEYAGYLHMELNAAAGTVLDIGWGEHLEDLRVRTSVGGRSFACRYICKDGAQKFTGYFRRLAGRYLQVHVTDMSGDVTFIKLGLLPVEYPLERIGKFKCNDLLYNRLYKAAEQTLRLCMHEHYEDCPWREQALYGYDSYLQMLCGYYMFGEYEFAKASLKLLADGQREDGLLPICAPTGERKTIPSFSLSWILSLEKYVLYSGDIDFGRMMLATAEKILAWFWVKDNLIEMNHGADYWHFYEWTEGLNGRGNVSADAACNCFYILAYEAYGRVCTYAGVKENAKLYSELDLMRKAVREKFYDKETGLFRTRPDEACYHELTQALAICSKVTEDLSICEQLLDENSSLIRVTLSSSFFKYEALLNSRAGYRDRVLEDMAGIWGEMLFAGAHTLWEVAEGATAFHNAGSLCHGWSAIPIYFLYKYYLGFEPVTPGFKEYRLEPCKTKYISELEAMLFTPDWEREIYVVDEKVVGEEKD